MKHDAQAMIDDNGKGFAHFVDEVLRGRSNKAILNSSVALAALEIGVPKTLASMEALDIARAVVNNSKNVNYFKDHPLFNFAAPTDEIPSGFTLFGLDFHDFWNQLVHGEVSFHHPPFYQESLATHIGLPDLPYGEMAHLSHIAMALYDTGRTFQEVWKETADYYQKHHTSPLEQGLALAAHLGKTITHPDMLHTLAARGVMLTTMGLLHPLGSVVSIGVSYLFMHLVHSAFGVLEQNKETIRAIEGVPVLGAIYNASGIKEWAERDLPNASQKPLHHPSGDAFAEEDGAAPKHSVLQASEEGRMQAQQPMLSQAG